MDQDQLNLILSQHKLWLDTNESKGQQANFSKEYIEKKYGKPAGLGHRVIFYEDDRGLRYKSPSVIQTGYTPFELENERISYFTGLDFSGANLDSAIFEDAVFYDCNMTNVHIQKCDLSRAKFRKVIFIGANLGSLSFDGIETYSNLSGSYFVDCDFSGNAHQKFIFTNTVLTGSFFNGCNLIGADFSGSTVNRTNFSNAKLLYAKFVSCNLEECDFIDSDLCSSDLSFANIHLANFSDANLNGVSFKLECIVERVKSAFSSKTSKDNFIGCRVEYSYGNERLKKAINEEVYIEEFAKENPRSYKLWLISSDCGRSIKLWLLWSLVVVLIFAAAYYGLGNCKFHFAKDILPFAEEKKYLLYVYYSVVTFTTLGFGDITPITIGAMAVVVLEVILGFIMLGLLISILANKVASRS